MQPTHRKHYSSLPRSALGLSKLRIEPRTERASRYVLAHAVTAREAAEMLDCTPSEVEAMVQVRTLVGRHIKTARGRLWIVCAACVADFQALPAAEREAAIAKAVAQATDEELTD
jgi:hypothetical protein